MTEAASARSRGRIAALLLLAVGVLFRTWAVGDARFTGDESWFWATARNLATFDAKAFYGPPLTGSSAYHPGPLFYYLMAVPQRLGTSPWIGGIFVALLHGLGAWLGYHLVVEARSARAGLVFLALWCFAPWDVLYADRIWLSCVAPVWGTITLYAAVRASRSAAWQGALVFFALVCPQLHMSAPIVWLASLVLLVFAWPERISWRALAVGVALAVLAYSPAIYAELTHNFENTRAIIEKGTGTLDDAGRRLAPLRVFGYAILYGSSEIGYHFGRGYWLPFSEPTAYGTAAGWQAWWALHGPLWGALSAVSLLLALAGFTYALVVLGRGLVAARRAGSVLRGLGLAERMMLALLAALVGAVVLLVGARKDYFPHYTNLLMPLLLWPVVLLVDALLDRARWRAVALALAVASMAAMASSSVRYYRTIDALNGLDTTLGVVDWVMAEGGPVAVNFDGFQNGFAWQMLANTKYHRGLELQGNAPVLFRVHNARAHVGEVPANARLFGPVLVERVERARPAP